MTAKTYFYITPDGVYRKDVNPELGFWYQASMKLASQSNLIVEMSEFGRGKSLKNRASGKTRYFTKEEMVMIALQAETL